MNTLSKKLIKLQKQFFKVEAAYEASNEDMDLYRQLDSLNAKMAAISAQIEELES